MEKYYLIRFSNKTGKIDTCLEGTGKGMLKMWALQNTPKTKDTIVFEKETGKIDSYFSGGDFPEVEKNCGNIEDYCPGLLEEILKENKEESLDEKITDVKESLNSKGRIDDKQNLINKNKTR